MKDDHKWYLGIMCETSNHTLYCQYADGQQDFGQELLRRWMLHHDQAYPHAITVLPLVEENRKMRMQ